MQIDFSTTACKYASKLLKAGDAALLLPQAARCKGPPDRLLIAHEACSACFVPMTAKSVSEVKLSNKRNAHHFETFVRGKGRFYGWEMQNHRLFALSLETPSGARQRDA